MEDEIKEFINKTKDIFYDEIEYEKVVDEFIKKCPERKMTQEEKDKILSRAGFNIEKTSCDEWSSELENLVNVYDKINKLRDCFLLEHAIVHNTEQSKLGSVEYNNLMIKINSSRVVKIIEGTIGYIIGQMKKYNCEVKKL